MSKGVVCGHTLSSRAVHSRIVDKCFLILQSSTMMWSQTLSLHRGKAGLVCTLRALLLNWDVARISETDASWAKGSYYGAQKHRTILLRAADPFQCLQQLSTYTSVQNGKMSSFASKTGKVSTIVGKLPTPTGKLPTDPEKLSTFLRLMYDIWSPKLKAKMRAELDIVVL